jgi:hypothetical protein
VIFVKTREQQDEPTQDQARQLMLSLKFDRVFLQKPCILPSTVVRATCLAYHILLHLLTYSVALVRKRTIPTEQLPRVGEVSANFCR